MTIYSVILNWSEISLNRDFVTELDFGLLTKFRAFSTCTADTLNVSQNDCMSELVSLILRTADTLCVSQNDRMSELVSLISRSTDTMDVSHDDGMSELVSLISLTTNTLGYKMTNKHSNSRVSRAVYA